MRWKRFLLRIRAAWRVLKHGDIYRNPNIKATTYPLREFSINIVIPYEKQVTEALAFDLHGILQRHSVKLIEANAATIFDMFRWQSTENIKRCSAEFRGTLEYVNFGKDKIKQ